MCGAADAFSDMSMSPHVVASVIVYFAEVSIVTAGSFFQLSFFTEPAAGFSHGSGALLLGEALGDASAPALVFLSSSFFSTPVVYSATLPITTTPSTDAITELRMRALRRALVRRCCCRKNFSRAS
ncbi:hypothetical protein TNCT1_59130 [Streptomyces sp. 1-11]|nr:hypothetical protein TNCT1_59130 [Streptomyces sp. 1-11]